SASGIALPFGFFASQVIERLFALSIVKYRLSTPGMSRSWPRVTSPSPARSILITSAPSHASSWVQVGPDCTCVKSRTRTPSSALPAWPQGLLDGRVAPLPFAFAERLVGFAGRVLRPASFTTLRAAALVAPR